MVKKINTPLTDKVIKLLKSGDEILLSGIIYTARDMAHIRLVEIIRQREKLPFNIIGSVIYYVGPAPTPPEKIIGSAGPTTSYRMDPFVEDLFKVGMKGMIGKGSRSWEVIDSIKKFTGVYFGATGGAAALISKSVVESEIIAFADLGTEAVRKLQVKDMPLIVVNDCYGGDLYKEGIEKYRI